MSRIYDNKPLSTIPVQNISWSSHWSVGNFQQGQGVILEGTIRTRARVAIIANDAKARYFVFAIFIKQAHRRVFDKSGKEMEPNFSQTQKVRTGYLHSSYKTDAKGVSDCLSTAELCRLINKDELSGIVKTSTGENEVLFWMDESSLANIDLQNSDEVRLKTRGDGPFIESIAKVNQMTNTVCNYAGGESVGSSWTDKVMAVKQQVAAVQQENEGVDDDEWDD